MRPLLVAFIALTLLVPTLHAKTAAPEIVVAPPCRGLLGVLDLLWWIRQPYGWGMYTPIETPADNLYDGTLDGSRGFA